MKNLVKLRYSQSVASGHEISIANILKMETLKKILVADDDELVRMLIKRALEMRGFEVIESDDGDTAVKMVESYSDIGLVILDLKMPRMGGKEAYTAIHRMRPGLKCVVSSAHINEDDKDELAALGVNAFLKKPYLIEELYRTVQNVSGDC